MKLKQVVFSAIAAVWILSGTALAETEAESRAPFDPKLSYRGRSLVLRSASLKEASVLKVNVYWVGLYLENAKTPPDKILTSKQVKAFVVHFLRDVKSSELQEAWIQDLTTACESDCEAVIAKGKALAGKIPDIRSSQEITYILYSDRVEVLIDGKRLGTMAGASSTRAVLATLLGPKAPSKMRTDLMGS